MKEIRQFADGFQTSPLSRRPSRTNVVYRVCVYKRITRYQVYRFLCCLKIILFVHKLSYQAGTPIQGVPSTRKNYYLKKIIIIIIFLYSKLSYTRLCANFSSFLTSRLVHFFQTRSKLSTAFCLKTLESKVKKDFRL